MTYELSPATINLMLECKRCFWLQLVKKIKRPSMHFPSLPSGMDRILKKHFDKFMEKGELPPEIREYGLRNGYKLFDDKVKLEAWRDIQKGIRYKDKESGVLLKGAIDTLLKKGRKLVVLDYKTRGYPTKEDTHKYYQVQMDIYNFLLRKNGYETENYAYLLFYCPKEITETGEVIFDTELRKIPTNAERGEKVFKKAIEILSGPMPEPSENCEFCKWRKNIALRV